MNVAPSQSPADVDIDTRDDDTYRIRHDVTQPDLCVTVSVALSEITQLEIEEVMSTVQRAVDPDALDRLFRVRPNGEKRDVNGRVRLWLSGHRVTIHSNGLIEITPADDAQ